MGPAYVDLKAKRKLSLILKSNSLSVLPLNVGYSVEIFRHGNNNKRGSWSQTKKIINLDTDSRTIYVPGKDGESVCASFEDERLATRDHYFSKIIPEAIDELDEDTTSHLDHIKTSSPKNENASNDIV